MNAKVNVNIQLSDAAKVFVELWDVDVLKDDLIDRKEIIKSGHVEFLFNVFDSGEFTPELQIRIALPSGKELYRTAINNQLSVMNVDKATGFREVTTIDFGTITV
jgi:hypothetical protein